MKLKYKITRDINVLPDILIDRITNVLSEEGYVVQKVTDKLILFNEDKRVVRSRWKAFSRLESGKFEVKKISDNLFMIEFEYYVSMILLIVVTVVLLIISIIEMRPIVLFTIPFFIELFARIETLKTASNRIIDSVMKR